MLIQQAKMYSLRDKLFGDIPPVEEPKKEKPPKKEKAKAEVAVKVKTTKKERK